MCFSPLSFHFLPSFLLPLCFSLSLLFDLNFVFLFQISLLEPHLMSFPLYSSMLLPPVVSLLALFFIFVLLFCVSLLSLRHLAHCSSCLHILSTSYSLIFFCLAVLSFFFPSSSFLLASLPPSLSSSASPLPPACLPAYPRLPPCR